ncbi:MULTISPECIES: hypothetical protein [Dysgonomonas]|uniref:terminase small subunit-like protein n=1 Tax=Dysgonomonas TaxID=156973 RepID=UPI0003F92FF6|nr:MULTISPECIES: hypothetical protein [Dysgonomonas]MBS7121423.1 hypothetical protein [Dysgonomonas sp.]
MAKYTEELGKKIADAIEQDEYTLGEICTMYSISRKTFYQWARNHSDFKEMIDDARAGRDERLAQKARKILKQRLEHGYTVTTTRYKYAVDEYGEIYLTGKTVTMKEYAADEKTLKMAMAKEGEIEEKVENIRVPWEIIVQNQEAADQIELLRNPGTEEEIREISLQIQQKYAATRQESDPNAYDPSLDSRI